MSIDRVLLVESHWRLNCQIFSFLGNLIGGKIQKLHLIFFLKIKHVIPELSAEFFASRPLLTALFRKRYKMFFGCSLHWNSDGPKKSNDAAVLKIAFTEISGVCSKYCDFFANHFLNPVDGKYRSSAAPIDPFTFATKIKNLFGTLTLFRNNLVRRNVTFVVLIKKMKMLEIAKIVDESSSVVAKG